MLNALSIVNRQLVAANWASVDCQADIIVHSGYMHGNRRRLGRRLSGNLAFVVLYFRHVGHFSIWCCQLIVCNDKVLFGAFAGCTSVEAMLLAVRFDPEIYLDLRFAPLALEAILRGTVSTAAAAIPAVAFRAYLGGTAALDGVVAILVISSVGAAIYLLPCTRLSASRDLEFLTVVLAVALTAMLAILPSPTKVGALTLEDWITAIALFFRDFPRPPLREWPHVERAAWTTTRIVCFYA